LAIVGAVALAMVYHLWQLAGLGGVPSLDIYGQQYPVLLYAWRSLRDGHGFLWNSLQNCGQPFLPSTPPGTLYPLNLLFLPFGLVAGFPAMAALHLAIGAAGVYALCRELGTRPMAALCGALAFELSGSAVTLATWLPTANLGAYVWLPVAMAVLERLLKHATPGVALALGGVLALQLLAGSPQVALFTDQVIGLRVLWALVTRQVARPGRLLAMLGLAGLCAGGFAAVQLLPSLEFIRESVRSEPLTLREIEPGGEFTWNELRKHLFPLFDANLVTLVPPTLAGAALFFRRRGIAAFYLIVLLLYGLMMIDNRVLSVYMALPFGRTFRFPSRFVWVSSFALSVLVGLGADAVSGAERESTRTRWSLLAALGLGGGIYCLAAPAWDQQRGLFAAVLAAGAWIVLVPRLAWLPRAALPVLLLVGTYLGVSAPFNQFADNDAIVTRYAAAFETLGALMTPQDRVFQYDGFPAVAVGPKSASIFGTASITDYEPQTSRRYAALRVKLAVNGEMTNSTQFNAIIGLPLVNRPLMNLLATRFVMSGPQGRPVEQWLKPPYTLRWEGDGVRIFENPLALPRAYYVPRLEVVEDARALLARLAAPYHRAAQVALVEDAPADGFLGLDAPPSGPGRVEIVDDRGESVRLNVTSPRPGFVVLTDQDYPGWEATVDGIPTPILRANYAFRAVRVPAGISVVEFRYRPRSVWLGAAITLGSLAAVATYAAVALGRRRRAAA
jgi:hypothetical protein